jgi:hypothetical protein
MLAHETKHLHEKYTQSERSERSARFYEYVNQYICGERDDIPTGDELK